MKKLKYLSVIFCMMLIPMVCVKADETKYEEVDYFNVVSEENISKSYKVNGNSIIGGNNVSVKNIVKGIDMVFGNNVTYKSISDYSAVFGNVVNVNGTTENDGFIFGNSINFDEDYKGNRDVFVFGNAVTIRGEISRDVVIFAESVIIENAKIGRNVTIYSSSAEVKNSEVSGKLYYSEDTKINISDDSKVNEKEVVKTENVVIPQKTFGQRVVDFLLSLCTTLVLFAAFALIVPALFKRIENKLEGVKASNVFAMLGFGLLALIAIPFVSILAFITIVGLQLGFFALAMYVIMLWLSTLFTGYAIGLLVWNKCIKKDTNILLVGLIGISTLKILTLIPIINAISVIFSILFALGLILKLFTKDA